MQQLPDIAARPHGKILVETRVAEGNAAADLERGASQTPAQFVEFHPCLRIEKATVQVDDPFVYKGASEPHFLCEHLRSDDLEAFRFLHRSRNVQGNLRLALDIA